MADERYCVFVSHATYDKWVATIICEKLESLVPGITTFRDDRDIEGGDLIPSAIMAALKSCDEFVVLLTPQSVDRQWVLIEIGMASILEKRIVPLLYHIEPEQMPGILRDTRAYSLNNLDEYLASVQKRRST